MAEIPSPGSGGKPIAQTDPLGPGLSQNKNKNEPDLTSKGNSNFQVLGAIIRVLAVLRRFAADIHKNLHN